MTKRYNFLGRPEGTPCCCLDGCCDGTTMPDCITLELTSSCCASVATIVLTKDTALTLCPGGVDRPYSAAFAYNGNIGSAYSGAIPADWCSLIEISGATVNIFCRTDPVTHERSWWIHIADTDLGHTWYDNAISPQYHRMNLISCDPLLLQIDSVVPDCGSNCIWTWVSGGCFIAGTMIETDKGSKPIEHMRTGDWVLDPFGKYGQVKSLTKYECAEWLHIYDEGGTVTGVTADHPFLLEDGITFRTLNYIDLGVKLHKGKSLSKVVVVEGKTTVHNMMVSGSRTYIANGYSVHNKGDE